MKLKFEKYQGAGNDFIIINNTDKSINLTPEQIQKLCDRHFGIGADGLIELTKSDKSDFSMVFYNPDGYGANMCGNGGRCIAKYAFDHNIAGKNMKFSADDGVHEACIIDDENVRIKMIDVNGITIFDDGMWTNTGVPHFVKFVDDTDQIDINTEGRKLADDKRFAPERTNVNFIDNKNGFRIRTYERGVEGETLACGTGNVASALCINTKYSNASPITLKTKASRLKVFFEKNNNGYTNIWLEGPAIKIFEGETDKTISITR
jgi:diaminopimelate epimerase